MTLRQVRSANGASSKQKRTLASLRLGRIGRTATLTDTPQLRGALSRVAHLVEVTSDGRSAKSRGTAGGKAGGGSDS